MSANKPKTKPKTRFQTPIKVKEGEKCYLLTDVYLFIKEGRVIAGAEYLSKMYDAFICTPELSADLTDKHIYNIYPSNNLYRIITNGGQNLTEGQKSVIEDLRRRYRLRLGKNSVLEEDLHEISSDMLRHVTSQLTANLGKKQLAQMHEKTLIIREYYQQKRHTIR